MPKIRRLPVVLSRQQVRSLIDGTKLFHFGVFFQLCYSSGLRLSDATQMQPGDIDADRGQIHVRNSKGGKDRIVPISSVTVQLLREYWKTNRNDRLILAATLESVDGSVDDIDVWVGGLAEDHVNGGSVGELFSTIIIDQFERLRAGDANWY